MKYAIIADIHGNLEAFQTVLKDAEENECTHYACLGDVVGYNANPKECLDIVRKMGMPCVKGNHDEYCSMEGDLEGFNPHAKAAIEWTQDRLTEDDRTWLRELKYFRLVANFSIVHATLDAPERWGYVFNKLEAASSFTYQNTKVCFFGHTHVPVAFVRDATIRGGTYSKFKVEPGKKILRECRKCRPITRWSSESDLRDFRSQGKHYRASPPRLRHGDHHEENSGGRSS
jgi:predicted phosphodiesterase